MRSVISAALVFCLMATACTKESLTGGSISASTADASRGSDDGGTSGSGGGTRISASSVPLAVMNAYRAKFPGATDAEWKKLSNGTYKVQFWRNRVGWEAIFSASGVLLKLERD